MSKAFEEWHKDYRKGGSIYDHQKAAWQAAQEEMKKDLAFVISLHVYVGPDDTCDKKVREIKEKWGIK